MMPKLKEKYLKQVVPELQKTLGYSSPMQVPKLVAIHVNQHIREAIKNRKRLDLAFQEMYQITGQKPIIIKAKKSIANFNVREGMPVAVRTTLRGNHMYQFLENKNAIAFQRIPNFRGFNPKSFDGRGNYTIGIKSQTIFPEILLENVQSTAGLDITLVTTAKDDKAAFALLKALGIPFTS